MEYHTQCSGILIKTKRGCQRIGVPISWTPACTGNFFAQIGYDQGEKVKVLMEENGFKNIKVIQDLAGLDRVVIGNF